MKLSIQPNINNARVSVDQGERLTQTSLFRHMASYTTTPSASVRKESDTIVLFKPKEIKSQRAKDEPKSERR